MIVFSDVWAPLFLYFTDFYQNITCFFKEQINLKLICRSETLAYSRGSDKTEVAAVSDPQDAFDYRDTYSSYHVLIIGSPPVASKSVHLFWVLVEEILNKYWHSNCSLYSLSYYILSVVLLQFLLYMPKH